MSKGTWQALVNMLVYGVQFQEPTDELAVEQARRLVEKPVGTLTQQEQFDRLAQAVESSTDELRPLCPDTRSEPEIRMYLLKILETMDQLRPWAEPPLRHLDVREWSRFETAHPIGFIALSIFDIQPRIDEVFDAAPDDGRRVCLLSLKSGVEIALVANWWPESSNVAILTHSEQPPNEIVDELVAATRLEAEQAQPLH
jgi:hypothetical protein